MTPRDIALSICEPWFNGDPCDGCECHKVCTKLINRIEAAIQEAGQRDDAFLVYAPGDVLICKESYERVVVKHGNTGPMQLANGKIALEWSDEIFGEYTLEQVMDGFIREWYAPHLEQAEKQEPLTKEYLLYLYNQLPNWGMDMDSLPRDLEKFARAIEAAHGIKETT